MSDKKAHFSHWIIFLCFFFFPPPYSPRNDHQRECKKSNNSEHFCIRQALPSLVKFTFCLCILPQLQKKHLTMTVNGKDQWEYTFRKVRYWIPNALNVSYIKTRMTLHWLKQHKFTSSSLAHHSVYGTFTLAQYLCLTDGGHSTLVFICKGIPPRNKHRINLHLGAKPSN